LWHQVPDQQQEHLGEALPLEVQVDDHLVWEHRSPLPVEDSLSLDAAPLPIWVWQQATTLRAWAVLPYRCPALLNYHPFHLRLRPT
jgi:hypothetical protein